MTAIKLAVVVLVIWAVRRTIYDALDQLQGQTWEFHPGWGLLSGSLYLLGLLPAGLFWHRVLVALGQRAELGESLRAYFVGHLGKYVPGKAMVIVIRAGLIRSQRVDLAVAALSVFYETLTMMAVGACMAAAILAVWCRDQTAWSLLLLAIMAIAATPTLPPVFMRLVRLVRVGRFAPNSLSRLGSLGYGTLLFGWAAIGIGWIVLGLSYWALLRAMGAGDANPLSHLPLYVAAVSLAMVAGFVSPIPGGAVVREAILAGLMVPHLGEGVAWVAAILLRLVWLLSEAVISSILYVIGQRPADVPP